MTCGDDMESMMFLTHHLHGEQRAQNAAHAREPVAHPHARGADGRAVHL